MTWSLCGTYHLQLSAMALLHTVKYILYINIDTDWYKITSANSMVHQTPLLTAWYYMYLWIDMVPVRNRQSNSWMFWHLCWQLSTKWPSIMTWSLWGTFHVQLSAMTLLHTVKYILITTVNSMVHQTPLYWLGIYGWHLKNSLVSTTSVKFAASALQPSLLFVQIKFITSRFYPCPHSDYYERTLQRGIH